MLRAKKWIKWFDGLGGGVVLGYGNGNYGRWGGGKMIDNVYRRGTCQLFDWLAFSCVCAYINGSVTSL